MTMTREERAEIAKKINALLAKTISAGATEAEALAAMNKAHELLEKYQLSMSDLEMKEEGSAETFHWHDEVSNALAVRVAEFCDCVVFIEHEEKEFVVGRGKKAKFEKRREKVLRFIGAKSDALFAEWLLVALTNFVHAEVLNKTLLGDYSEAQGIDYQNGIVHRLNERMHEEVTKRQAARAADARSLIVVKNALVDEHLAKTFRSRPKYSQRRIDIRDVASYNAGLAKGDTPALRRPIEREMKADIKRIA